MSTEKSLQETYGPSTICFGCGPANPKGLRIRSFLKDDGTFVCDWMPQAHHEAFPGVLNGGITGSLLDCHSNWAAAIHQMRQNNEPHPPCTVTADYAVKLRRPIPSNAPVHLVARVVESSGKRTMVEAELLSGGKVCATCRGTFVSVDESHPAFHRWG